MYVYMWLAYSATCAKPLRAFIQTNKHTLTPSSSHHSISYSQHNTPQSKSKSRNKIIRYQRSYSILIYLVYPIDWTLPYSALLCSILLYSILLCSDYDYFFIPSLYSPFFALHFSFLTPFLAFPTSLSSLFLLLFPFLSFSLVLSFPFLFFSFLFRFFFYSFISSSTSITINSSSSSSSYCSRIQSNPIPSHPI